MATELLALAAGADSAGRILTATDRKNTEFLDVLIENEQKEVIAHTVVQRYLQVNKNLNSFVGSRRKKIDNNRLHSYNYDHYQLQELWRGVLNWSGFKLVLLLFAFILCPPVWVIFTLPLGHKYSKVPIIKFMSYLTSHIYLMLLLGLTGKYTVLHFFSFVLLNRYLKPI